MKQELKVFQVQPYNIEYCLDALEFYLTLMLTSVKSWALNNKPDIWCCINNPLMSGRVTVQISCETHKICSKILTN